MRIIIIVKVRLPDVRILKVLRPIQFMHDLGEKATQLNTIN